MVSYWLIAPPTNVSLVRYEESIEVAYLWIALVVDVICIHFFLVAEIP